MTRRYLLDARPATNHFPGIGRYVSHLAAHLVPLLASDEELLLLHNPGRASAWPLPAPQDKVRFLETAATPFSISQQWQIPRLLRRHRVDLYHSAYYLMPYRPGVPTLLTLYDFIPAQFPSLVSPRARLLFEATTRLALGVSEKVIAISQATADELCTRHLDSAHKVTTVALAAENRFKPQPEAAVVALKQRVGLDSPYVLYLGINKPHKNLARLCDAWTAVTAQLLDAPLLVIAGAWDPRYGEVKEKVKKGPLQNKVRFLGAMPDKDLPALYSGAELFIFPTLVEGFGLPVLEAMACGTAVACSDSSSLPEVGGAAVAYFDPWDVAQITAVLLRLLQDEGEREDLAHKGLVQAGLFSWEKTAHQTLELYRLMTAQRK